MRLRRWLIGLRTSLFVDTNNDRKRIGDRGEVLAKSFLKKKGWKIVSSNLRFGRDELDILAIIPSDDTLVIIEVRTTARKNGNPEATFSKKKLSAMRRIARRVESQARRHGCILRIDIITVRLSSSEPYIRHYENVIKIRKKVFM